MKVLYIDGGGTGWWLAVKYAQALQQGGADVELVQLLPPARSPVTAALSDHSVPTRPLYIRGRGQRLKLRIARARLFCHLLRTRADCYVASDPSVLGICRFAARVHRARSVYVPCEYYPHLSYGPPRLRKRWQRVERRHVPHLSAIVLLGDKLADEYRSAYDLGDRVHVVYSSWPARQEAPRPVLRERLGLGPAHRVVLYQGTIEEKRGLLSVLAAMPLLPRRAVFVILGYGPHADLVRRRAEELGVADRVHVLDPVPQQELMAYAGDADVGIIPILNVCRSYYLCNPGKLFEYIAAGLPLAVSNLAQLQWYVTTRGLGEVFDPEDVEDVARALRHLLEDDRFRAECAARSRETQRKEACWEIQSERLRKAVLGDAYSQGTH